ncbi:hypothetical protein HAX54_007233 [Datura stramonium]|uniref:Uncharacterized protein n=1 Tax=Datura stramonium TaxID=4076 RepID=A0ABS8TCB3_DATST|nr:hypothetical protein [Datura stramonium]
MVQRARPQNLQNLANTLGKWLMRCARAARLPPHYEELKSIIAIEPKMSTKALDKYFSLEDPLARALVYGKEQVKSSEVNACFAVLEATSPHLRRDAPFEMLDKSLTWEKPKPSIEKG